MCTNGKYKVLVLQRHSGEYFVKVEISDPLTWVWCASIADNLSQQDAKGPDVRFDGERAVVDGLRGCPFDGEFGSCFLWTIENKSVDIVMETLVGS